MRFEFEKTGQHQGVGTLFINGEKVMVFCKAGKHRSATTSSFILAGLGHSATEAIKIVEAGRDAVEIKETHRRAICDFEQVWCKRNPQG